MPLKQMFESWCRSPDGLEVELVVDEWFDIYWLCFFLTCDIL